MKVILFMAVSANGIIASTDGSEDFLSHENWIEFVKLPKKAGCLIWGRKTYESVITWEGDYLKDLRGVKKLVLSHSRIDVQKGFELVHSPEQALEKLENDNLKQVIVTGGATTNSAFAKNGLIDEVIFFVNPAILGKGIPIFSPEKFYMKLELVEIKRLKDQIIKLHYTVKS